jgi:hypothetical protein
LLTAVDHIVVGATDLDRLVDTFRRLGFTVTPGGEGSRLAHAVFANCLLEFREVAASVSTVGLQRIVLRSDDLDAEVARLRSSGVPVSEAIDDPSADGATLTQRRFDVDAVVPIALVEHEHDFVDEIHHFGVASHPNTATTLERVYLAVDSIERELDAFARVLGLPAPEPELGTVIMSLMSVFYVGTVGIAVAEPRGPGPTADALRANGPGLFQLLFRADHLDQAAQVMADNGLPSPSRGTRLSGESALLVDPTNAGNVYVGLAGLP